MRLIIANLIALIASLLTVYFGTLKEKKKILYVQSMQLACYVLSNAVLNAIPGAIINAISFVRNILCYKDKLGLKEKIILTILSIVLTVAFNNLGFVGYLPLFATVSYLWFMTIKDVIQFKYLMIFTLVLWFSYDFSIQSYTSACFDLFAIVANIISIIKLKR